MKSLRGPINDKCRSCIYDPLSGLGNWRQQVTRCSVYSCPLWPVRPTSEGFNAPTDPNAHLIWLERLELKERAAS